MEKIPFVSLQQLQEITAQYPTPFHLYDEAGIRSTAPALLPVFAGNRRF